MLHLSWLLASACESSPSTGGGDSTAQTGPCAAEVGDYCGSDCFGPDDGWCMQCGSLRVDASCACRPDNCGAIPECAQPGLAQADEPCGDVWWCTRGCEAGLVCALEVDPCEDANHWRRVCKPAEGLAPERISGRCERPPKVRAAPRQREPR